MKKYSGFVLISSVIVFISFASNPPQGNSGAPFDRTCARSGCHSGGAGINGSVSISGIPDEVMAGESYEFKVILEATTGSPQRGGFQMIAVNSQQRDGGTISNTGNGSTISTFLDRTYFEHQPAQNFNQNLVEYSATWTAPEDGTTTFYVGAIFANGNGGSSGDANFNVSKVVNVIEEQSALSAQVVDIENASCFGVNDGSARVEATGGAGSYTYNWSSGESGPLANALSAGENNVSVISGDQAVNLTFKIDQPEEITVSLSPTENIACTEGMNGAITAETTNAINPVVFDWSNGATGQVIEGLGIGIYNVTATDTNGCTGEASISMFAIDQEPPSFTVPDEIRVELSSDIQSVTVLDIISERITDLSDNCTSSPTLSASLTILDCSNVGLQDITLTVTDDSGNSTTDNVTVSVVDVEAPSIDCVNSVLEISTCGSFGYTQPQVNDNCENTRLELISGVGINGNFPIGESIEVYQVTDLSDNTATCQITIKNDPELVVEVNTTDVSCLGENDGRVDIEVQGLNPPFNIEVFGGVTSNLTPGDYSFTVTDFTGCATNSSFMITEPVPLIIDSTTLVKPSTSNSGDGSIDVTISGGTPPYEYFWTVDGDFFSDSEDLTLLFPGVYQVMVTDNRGCIVASEEFMLEEVTDINDPLIVQKINYFPNPADLFVNLRITDLRFAKGALSIYNAKGALLQVDSFDKNEIKINTSGFSNGLYILKLRIDDEVIVHHILIQH